MTTKTAWQMRGDVFEVCSCDTTCPCNFASDATRQPCEAILGLHIKEGHYGDTRLDGLNFVFCVRMPGHIFQGGWTLGLYLDERANEEQAQSLGTIISGQAGGWFPAILELVEHQLAPKQVPIEYETVDGEVRLTVPGLLQVETERIPNPMGDPPLLDPTVDGLAVPFYTGPARVRRSSIVKLTDPDMSFEYSQRSSLIGQFEYAGP